MGTLAEVLSNPLGVVEWFVYLLAAVLFVVGLHMMNSPKTARKGNLISAAGMVMAVVMAFIVLFVTEIGNGFEHLVAVVLLIVGILIGTIVGVWSAKKVKMTDMPQLVSVFNTVGGGAAALVGAAGVALGNMVGDLTTGKKKYAAVEEEILVLNARAEALRKRLEALVQADADAFTPLAAAYGLPRETPEQQARKAAVLAEALDGACAVPLDIMDACCEGIRLAAYYAEKGSVLALSDAGCAALFCKAALQASALNVAINTKLMTDRAHAAALDEKAARMLAEYLPLADEVYQSVASRLRA